MNRSQMIRQAGALPKGSPQRRKILASLKNAGGTSMGVFGSKQEALVGPRQIKKLVQSAAGSLDADINDFDFKNIQWADEKDVYGRPQVTWRLYRKGSIGDKDAGYIYGYVKATVMASSKGGAYIECRVSVAH